MTLFERVKNIAQKRGMSIAEVERKSGLSENYLYTWKKTDNPRKTTVESVANTLGVSTDELLGNNEKVHNSPDWATESDRIDLDKLLQSNTPMGYGEMSMSPEDREKVRNVIEGIYWDRLKELREKGEK